MIDDVTNDVDAQDDSSSNVRKLGSNKKRRNLAVKARKTRNRRARRLIFKLSTFVGLPTLLSVVYFAFIASDVYESTSVFMVQSSENRHMVGLESILGGVTGSGTSQDSLAIKEFILSRDMLTLLDNEQDFIKHYQQKQADWWSRLNSDSSFEETFEYYLERVEIEYDTISGVLSMTVKSYSPEKTKGIAQAILTRSEEKVNTLSARARQDQIDFARKEVQTAEKRFADAQTRILKLQNEQSDLHPGRSASSLLAVRTQMEGELAAARTELAQARAVMRNDAPKVISLKQKVNAISRQISLETKRLVGTESTGLNTSIIQFESAMMEKTFAEKGYQSAMASLEIAKMEASRQSRYLAVIASPISPDEATYPKRILGVVTIFFLSLALFGIGSLLIAAVREHARV